MVTTREILTSVAFTILFTMTLTALHSLKLLFDAIAFCTALLGIYWSYLAYSYKQRYLQAGPLFEQCAQNESEFPGWWAGWPAIVSAIFFSFWGTGAQWTSLTTEQWIYTEAALCSISSFIAGSCYSMLAWWLWRKYEAAIKLLV